MATRKLTKFLFMFAATAFVGTDAEGINCKGSGLCASNGGILSQALGQLKGMDQSQQYGDNQQITCVESSVTIDNPSLCIFYQKTGRQFTVAQTVSYAQSLLNHGCGACGSVPTDEGNNVDNGELTANMVTNAPARRDVLTVKEKQRRNEKKASDVLKKRAAGINCAGSSSCGIGGLGGLPYARLEDVRDAVAAGPDGTWTDGQQIACAAHATGRLCAYYQKTGGRTFTKDQSIAYLDSLMDHGCSNCGSIPVDDGNNTNNGELTVNFVS
jgi:hypothetical protein